MWSTGQRAPCLVDDVHCGQTGRLGDRYVASRPWPTAAPAPTARRSTGSAGSATPSKQRGNDFYGWIDEENFAYPDFAPLTDAPPEQGAAGEDGFMFPNGPTAAYHVQSLIASLHGYGFLLDQSEMAADARARTPSRELELAACPAETASSTTASVLAPHPRPSVHPAPRSDS